MSAHIVYDAAPLGSMIRYSDGAAKPPSRFTKKLAAWESRNGAGRLLKKEPPKARATYCSPAYFTLHEGDFGQGGIIVVSVRRTYSVESDRRFDIVERSASCRRSATARNFCISPRTTRQPSVGSPTTLTAEAISRGVTVDEVGADVIEGRTAA